MRNLKALGLVSVAVFAMSAGAAPVASANQFHSTATNTTVTRSANTNQLFEYETGGETVACTTIGGSGQSTHQTATEVTFSPTYSGCSVIGVAFSKVVVDMNGCQYLFTIGASSNSGPVHVKCPGGENIELTVSVFGVLFCIYHIAEQTPTGVADYFNSGSTKVNVTATQTGISATMEPITMGGLACGSQTSTTGSYTGQVQVSGEETGTQNAKNIQVG